MNKYVLPEGRRLLGVAGAIFVVFVPRRTARRRLPCTSMDLGVPPAPADDQPARVGAPPSGPTLPENVGLLDLARGELEQVRTPAGADLEPPDVCAAECCRG